MKALARWANSGWVKYRRRVAVISHGVAICLTFTACNMPARKQPASLPRAELPISAELKISASPQTASPANTAQWSSQEWPAEQWWVQLRDDQLDDLIERALRNAPDLQQAQARVAIAVSAIEQTRAELGVKIDARAQAERTRLSKNLGLLGSSAPADAASSPSITSLGLVGLQFQYDFDWWGKRRAAVDAAVDRARASDAGRAAAALLLQNGVATSYCGWLADQQRLQLTQQMIALYESELHIAQRRRDSGIDSADAEQMARTDLATALSQQAMLSSSAHLHLVQLAALLGIAPDQLPRLQARPLPQFATPLPADTRIALLGRRPDIVANRWRIEAASEDIEEARKAYLPDISISALVFFASDDFHKLFDRDSLLWSVGPAITLPIFEGGRIHARYGVSRAQLEAAIADYNATVITAARDVATQVLTLDQLNTQRTQQQTAIAASTTLLANANARARQGLVDRRTQNNADVQALRARDAALQIDAQFITTQLALIKALGGGYEIDAAASAQKDSAMIHAVARSTASETRADR
ncbi:MAG: hypothetical protein JWM78_1506 [Verrucomicrobiaceae bacterium]|nr:hypothetical protein [Verrucomicrobiaceae bacterium]